MADGVLRGRVSGSVIQASAQSKSATVIMNQKIERQPISTSSQPPMIGAMAGATPKKSVIWLIRRCACTAAKRSRTIARPTTMPAPQLMPCSARPAISTPMRSAKAQIRLASANRTSPPRMTGRRPKLSESAPCSSIITENPSR